MLTSAAPSAGVCVSPVLTKEKLKPVERLWGRDFALAPMFPLSVVRECDALHSHNNFASILRKHEAVGAEGK